MAPRVLAAALAAAALVAPGCGGGDGGGQVQEDALRDCLTEEGLTVEASDLGSSAGLGNATPDFQAMSDDGEIADLLVEGSDSKASRRAADITGARQSFGAGQTDVVVRRNAVVVFEQKPPAGFREQVTGCVD